MTQLEGNGKSLARNGPMMPTCENVEDRKHVEENGKYGKSLIFIPCIKH